MTKYLYKGSLFNTLEEALEKAVSCLEDKDLINIWNDYCYSIDDLEGFVYQTADIKNITKDLLSKWLIYHWQEYEIFDNIKEV